MQQISFLLSIEDSIPAICSMLVNESGSKLISIIIDSLDRILIVGWRCADWVYYEDYCIKNGNQSSSVIKIILNDCGCLDNIEKLETIDEETYKKTRNFIDRYFGFEDNISFDEIQ